VHRACFFSQIRQHTVLSLTLVTVVHTSRYGRTTRDYYPDCLRNTRYETLTLCFTHRKAEGGKYLCPSRRFPKGTAQPVLLEESHVAPVKMVKFAPGEASFGLNNGPAGGPTIDGLVTASADGQIRGWTLDPRPICLMRAGLRTGAVPLCVAVTSLTTITGWDDGHVRCHDNKTGELMWTLPDAHVGGVTAIGVAVGGHFFVTGGVKGEVRVWDSRSRRLISTLKEHCAAVIGVEALGDDVHIVSASRDRSIITWDLIRERRVAQHKQRVGSINAFELSRADGPNSTRMVSVGQDRSLSFWDLMQDKALQVVPGAHAQECTCASLSPHGVLATGSKDQSVKVRVAFPKSRRLFQSPL